MRHQGRKPDARQRQDDPSRTSGSASDQRTPGKRTHAMNLQARPATGSRTMQRDATDMDRDAQRPAREPVEDWTLVATRPDLHQTPVLRPENEVGMAVGPRTRAVQMKKGDDAVAEGGGGDRERKKESRRERDQRRGELKPQEVETATSWMTLFAEAQRVRTHQQGREEHEIKDALRTRLLDEIEQHEEELLARAGEIEWQEQFPIFGDEYKASYGVLGNLNSTPMDMVDAHEQMMGVLSAWRDDMERFVVEEQRRRERQAAEEELRQVRLEVENQLRGPRQTLQDLLEELATEIPKGTRSGTALERQRKELLKEAQGLRATANELARSITRANPRTRQLQNLVSNVRDLASRAGDWVERRDDALGTTRGTARETAKTLTRTEVSTLGLPTEHVHQDAVAELNRYLGRWHMHDDILQIWGGTGEDRTAPGTDVLHHHANSSFQHNVLYLGTVILGVVDGHMQTKARTGVADVEKKVVARRGGPTVEVALAADGVYRVVNDT